MNSVKTVALMIVLMLLFMWIGYLFGGSGGMVIAFVIASVMNLVTYWYSDKIVLKMYRAREIQEADHPRLYRIVKRVATQAMMPMPKVYIVPSRGPNAFATGRDANHAAVAATEGILEILSEEELEGVIGHEVAHIRNKDMLIGTVAAIVAPIVAILVQTAISRQREFKADAEAGEITGKYLPLASALDKLHRSPVKLNVDDRPATANLMIVNPLSGRGFTNLFSTHPPVEQRIAKLKELSQQAVYKPYVG